MLLFFIFFLVSFIFCHECVHDKLVNEIESQVSVQQYGSNPSKRAVPETRNIRVVFDARFLGPENDKSGRTCSQAGQFALTNERLWYYCQETDVLTDTRRRTLVDVVLPRVAQFFANLTRVRPVIGPLYLSGSADWCGTDFGGRVPIPIEYTRDSGPGLPDADIVLFTTAFALSQGQETLASAISCQQDQHGRPVAGLINVRPASVDDVDRAVKILIHECLHALVMSGTLIPDFVDRDTLQPLSQWTEHAQSRDVSAIARNVYYGDTTYLGHPAKEGGWLVKTPRVQAAVRDHFGCPALEGAPLESADTSPGLIPSHWERLAFRDELMTPIEADGRHFVSAVTLALMDDSGWYWTNPAMADQNPWLSNIGCEAFTEQCTQWFGAAGVTCQYNYGSDCSFDRQLAGYCSDHPTNQGCSWANANPNGGICASDASGQHEHTPSFYWNGPDSLCFTSQLVSVWRPGPSCLRHRCTNTTNLLEIMNTLTGLWVQCPVDGGTVETIVCPPSSEICCQPACENGGRCVQGKCYCQAGHTGPDCATVIPSTFLSHPVLGPAVVAERPGDQGKTLNLPGVYMINEKKKRRNLADDADDNDKCDFSFHIVSIHNHMFVIEINDSQYTLLTDLADDEGQKYFTQQKQTEEEEEEVEEEETTTVREFTIALFNTTTYTGSLLFNGLRYFISPNCLTRPQHILTSMTELKKRQIDQYKFKLPRPAGCSIRRKLSVRFVADHTFYRAMNSDEQSVRAFCRAAVSYFKFMFEEAVNVEISIGKIDVYQQPAASYAEGQLDRWNYEKCVDSNDKLDDFAQWTSKQPDRDQYGAFVLLTDCYRGRSVVGRMFLSSICHVDDNAEVESFGAGIITLQSFPKTFITIAHELGHSLGSQHTGAGLMYFADTGETDLYLSESSQTAICRSIALPHHSACAGFGPDQSQQQQCVPNCAGGRCGSDGCGGQCAVRCGTKQLCVDGQCVCEPVDCLKEGLECGTNGCDGGSCGQCPSTQKCSLGKCVDDDNGGSMQDPIGIDKLVKTPEELHKESELFLRYINLHRRAWDVRPLVWDHTVFDNVLHELLFKDNRCQSHTHELPYPVRERLNELVPLIDYTSIINTNSMGSSIEGFIGSYAKYFGDYDCTAPGGGSQCTGLCAAWKKLVSKYSTKVACARSLCVREKGPGDIPKYLYICFFDNGKLSSDKFNILAEDHPCTCTVPSDEPSHEQLCASGGGGEKCGKVFDGCEHKECDPPTYCSQSTGCNEAKHQCEPCTSDFSSWCDELQADCGVAYTGCGIDKVSCKTKALISDSLPYDYTDCPVLAPSFQQPNRVFEQYDGQLAPGVGPGSPTIQLTSPPTIPIPVQDPEDNVTLSNGDKLLPPHQTKSFFDQWLLWIVIGGVVFLILLVAVVVGVCLCVRRRLRGRGGRQRSFSGGSRKGGNRSSSSRRRTNSSSSISLRERGLGTSQRRSNRSNSNYYLHLPQ